MKIYLDNCCYNRPFDDQSQSRIQVEALAVLYILMEAEKGRNIILGSDILDYEIDQMSVHDRKIKATLLASIASEHIELTDAIQARANDYVQASNIHAMDSLHLASAESANADYLLTVDDKFIGNAGTLDISVKVMNPVNFLITQ